MRAREVDCLVVGAGPAGLTAATYLARFRRTIALVDAGRQRARLIPVSRNCPGFPEGISGVDLLARMRSQATHYGVHVEEGRVETLGGADGRFTARWTGGEIVARKVLLATGIVDNEPDMTGFRAAIECGVVRLCAICDAYEVIDRKVALYGPARTSYRHAVFMRTYTRDVTLLVPPDDEALRAQEAAELDKHGVRRVAEPVTDLFLTADKRAGARTASGKELRFDVIYPSLGCAPRNALARELGARLSDNGEIVVDNHQRSSVAGLYAAGDIVDALNQVSVAVGQAAIAATDIHNELR